jgi:hypothetical protein
MLKLRTMWEAGRAARRGGFEAHHEKEARDGLEFMNAAAQKRCIGFKKNIVAAMRDGADEMCCARVKQRFAASDPNDGRTAGNHFANLFVRNRMT